jgi:hypothetical protein
MLRHKSGDEGVTTAQTGQQAPSTTYAHCSNLGQTTESAATQPSKARHVLPIHPEQRQDTPGHQNSHEHVFSRAAAHDRQKDQARWGTQ